MDMQPQNKPVGAMGGSPKYLEKVSGRVVWDILYVLPNNFHSQNSLRHFSSEKITKRKKRYKNISFMLLMGITASCRSKGKFIIEPKQYI